MTNKPKSEAIMKFRGTRKFLRTRPMLVQLTIKCVHELKHSYYFYQGLIAYDFDCRIYNHV